MRKFLSFLCAAVLLQALCLPLTAFSRASERILTPDEISSIEAALADENKSLPISEEFRVYVDPHNLSAVRGLDPYWTNILLMGTDTGDIRLNYGRTDAMLVLSVNTATGEMKLTSLVRDMLVDIPGLNIQNRINAANSFGGPLLAIKTVNEVLGLNIQRYCSINFSGFEDVVDYLGGVTLTLDSAEASIVEARHSSSPQLLTGEQALRYVRIRHLDDNFGRNERQRKFLTSLMSQVKHSSMENIMSAVSAVFQAMATNLTVSEIVQLLPAAMRGNAELRLLSLPPADTYTFRRTNEGASVVEFDLDATRNVFHTFVYGE